MEFCYGKKRACTNSKVAYDLNCKLKEDIDYTVQVLKAGYQTMITSQIAVNVPPNASLKGGCFDEYVRQGRERDVCNYIQKKWGKGLIKIIMKKNGRWDVKLNYKKLSQRST